MSHYLLLMQAQPPQTAIDMVVGRGLGGYATTAELIVGGNYPTSASFLTT